MIQDSRFINQDFLVGGGVAANIEVRKKLRKISKSHGIKVHFPYTKKLTGDNAAMIGIAAYFKAKRGEFIDPDKIDRDPKLKL
jgi:tRNA A37 threonylcarbamoyltransferase TsaD